MTLQPEVLTSKSVQPLDPLTAIFSRPELLEKIPVDTVERLVALRERALADTARREYHAAFADFQQNCPVVRKLRTAKIDSTRTGAKFAYSYADAADVVQEIGDQLWSRGFSYSFDTKVAGGMCEVTCRLHHAGGHSGSASVSVPPDSSAAMSPQQKIAAARSFAKRLALLDVLGLFTADPEPEEASVRDMHTLNEDQVATVSAMLDELPSGRRAGFHKWIGTDTIEAIAQNRYGEVILALEKARKA